MNAPTAAPRKCFELCGKRAAAKAAPAREGWDAWTTEADKLITELSKASISYGGENVSIDAVKEARKNLIAHIEKLAPDAAPPAAKAVEMDADKQFSQFFIDTIERVESRCMAADGPVTPTCDEITDGELRALYVAAQQVVNPSSTTER